MVIKDWNELDINLNYTCSCGFTSYTKPLVLSKENFVVFPKKKQAEIQENNKTVSVVLNLERTYPKPDCHISIGKDKQTKLVLKSEKNGLFDDYECRQQIKISNNGCYKPRVVCQIMNSTIIDTTGDQLGICTGDTTTKELDSTNAKETTTWTSRKNKPPGAGNNTLTIVIVVASAAVVVFTLTICFAIHIVSKTRQKQNQIFKKSREEYNCERGNKYPESSDGSNTSISPLMEK